MNNERERNLIEESARVKSRITDSFITAAKQGEVQFDFSGYDDSFLMLSVTAYFKEIRFFSYDEQSSGVRLKASWEDENGEEHRTYFGFGDAYRFRQIVDLMANKDLVLKSIRRKERAELRKTRVEEKKTQRKELEALDRIAKLLKP